MSEQERVDALRRLGSRKTAPELEAELEVLRIRVRDSAKHALSIADNRMDHAADCDVITREEHRRSPLRPEIGYRRYPPKCTCGLLAIRGYLDQIIEDTKRPP